MNKANKILLLSFLPVLLTVIFALYVLIPSFDSLNTVKKDFESQTNLLNELKDKVANAKNNKENLSVITKLRERLADFEQQVSDDYDSALLVFDSEKIAYLSGVQLLSFNIKDETNEEEQPLITRKNKKEQAAKKIKLTELVAIPVEINIKGNYLSVIEFVRNLESYQRKINVNTLEIQRADKSSPDQIQAKLNCKFYKVKKSKALEVK
jgi:Tfp pilus assembly protein PilO